MIINGVLLTFSPSHQIYSINCSIAINVLSYPRLRKIIVGCQADLNALGTGLGVLSDPLLMTLPYVVFGARNAEWILLRKKRFIRRTLIIVKYRAYGFFKSCISIVSRISAPYKLFSLGYYDRLGILRQNNGQFNFLLIVPRYCSRASTHLRHALTFDFLAHIISRRTVNCSGTCLILDPRDYLQRVHYPCTGACRFLSETRCMNRT